MKKSLSSVLLLLVLFPTFGQELSKKHYARAVSFLWPNPTNNKVFNLSIQVSWFADSSGFSHVTYSSKEKVFNKFDFKDMKTTRLFDHDRLARVLNDSLKTRFTGDSLPFNTVSYVNKSTVDFNVGGKGYRLDLKSWKLEIKKPRTNNAMEARSPDDKWTAFTKDHNLYVRSATTNQEKQLSKDGKKNYEYASYYEWGELIEGENGERPPHFGVYWSPDSKWIQTYICDLSKGQKMYLLDWSVDSLYRARL